MKLFPVVSVLLGTAALAYVQLSEIGAPAAGSVLYQGRKFTAQVIVPYATYCEQVGIALAIGFCYDGVCPPPSEALDNVVYSGPWNPTLHHGGQYYQNFTLKVPPLAATGPSIFTVTHLCLLGAGPTPVLEYLNVSVTVKASSSS